MPEGTPRATDAPPSSPAAPHEAGATRPARREWVAYPDEPQEDAPREDAAEQPAKPRRRFLPWLILVIVVGGLAYLVTHRSPAEPPAGGRMMMRGTHAVPIVTATVHKGSIDVYLTALGTVTPVNTVTVTSRVQGQIMAVDFREGQMVRKGEALLTIDPRPYQAAVTQAQGQHDHDQAVLEEARIDLDRYKAAFARNAIPKQQLDDQEKVVQQDEGTVKNDQGALDNAKVNLQYCYITSPIDGRVGLRLVDPGNIVVANSSTGLLVITQLQPITVVMSVAEDYLPQIQEALRQGHKLAVDAFDRAQQKLIAHGSLLTLDNVIDPTTGTLKLKAIFPNEDGTLFPNQFVNARLLVATEQNVNLVPSAAVQRNAQGAFVYVVGADQTAQSRPITVGNASATDSAVTGVEPGEVVAINGFDKLLDGIKVTPYSGAPPGMGGGAGHRRGAPGQPGQPGQQGQPGQGQHRHRRPPSSGDGGSGQ